MVLLALITFFQIVNFFVHFSVEKGRNFDSRPPKAALRAGLEGWRLSRDGVGCREAEAGVSPLGPGLAFIPGPTSDPGVIGTMEAMEDMEVTPETAGEERGDSDPPPPP